MKELVAHGPTTSVINCPPYFSQYLGCILEQDCEPFPGELDALEQDEGITTSRLQFKTDTGHKLNGKTLRQRGVEWEFVNHSITLVGFGTDTTCLNDEYPFRIQNHLNSRIMVDLQNPTDCPHDGRYWILANSWGTG